MLSRLATIEAIGPAVPQNGAMYPSTTFGRQLRDVAHISRSGVGLENLANERLVRSENRYRWGDYPSGPNHGRLCEG